MNFHNPEADAFVPDGTEVETALARTTHLAVVAHQDDIEIMAYHGVAACFGVPGQWFTGIVVSDGAGSPRSGIYERYTDAEMKQVRIREQRKAAYVGEYACQLQLGYPSAAVKNPENKDLRSELASLFAHCGAKTIYLHNLADKHPTHIGVAVHSIAALRRLPRVLRPTKVYGCEVWRDLDWLPDDQKQGLSVSSRENIASALVGIFDSQITGGKRYDLATPGRRLANATYFAPHSTDTEKALTFAMDLTPLIEDPELSPSAYVIRLIDRFRDDVEAQVKRFL